MQRNLTQRKGIFNKIPMEGGQIRHELVGETFINWSISIYNDKNDLLVIGRNGEYKTVRVVSDGEWAVKVMKTRVRAMGGAMGLFNFFDYGCTRSQVAYEFKFLQSIWDHTKSIM